MPDAYCDYHGKPLRDVGEHEQETCGNEGFGCQTCPYLTELREGEEAETNG